MHVCVRAGVCVRACVHVCVRGPLNTDALADACASAQALNVMCDVGQVYFYNSETKESLWEHPMDEHYRQLVVYWRDAYARFASPSIATSSFPDQQADAHATLPVMAGERSRESPRKMFSTPSRASLRPRCARHRWKMTR